MDHGTLWHRLGTMHPHMAHTLLASPARRPALPRSARVQPQQAGTVRKNAYIVIKGRPCKVGGLVLPLERLCWQPWIKPWS